MSRDYLREEVERQAIAAAGLLQELNSEDDVLNHDMIEGETGFFEAVERALDHIRECDTLLAGIADTKKALSDREARVKQRRDRLRGLIEQAFAIAQIKSHTFPCETVTTKAVPPKLIVSDEAEVPSQYFEPQPPKLDRKALLAAVKEGDVPGASLSNGGMTIQIRRA